MGALPEMWDAMHSWFTPSVLFLVLNLVIGTIAFTSALRTPKPPHQQHTTNNTAKLSNTPSFLHRITSFNFNTQHSQAIPSQPQPDEPMQTQEVEAEAEQDQDNEDEQVQEEVVVEKEEQVEIAVALGRSKSDAQPLADLRPPPLPSRLKKSGTVDSPFAHFVRSDCIEGDEQGQDEDVHVGDKEDDFKAKADSFIRGFKEQLKLQRNESFLRYRAMLHRGTHS